MTPTAEKYVYMLQSHNPESLRRFDAPRKRGERWDASAKQWTRSCCDYEACQITGDRKLSEEEVQELFPEAVQ